MDSALPRITILLESDSTLCSVFILWSGHYTVILVSQRLPWIRANMKPSLVNFTLWDCFCERQIYFKVKKLINDL